MSAWAKAGIGSGGLLLLVGVWAYLAGGIFLLSQHRSFDSATPLTLYQYWLYYGHHPAVQKWLYISSGISLAFVLLPVGFILTPKKRSLFGDARFATDREIRKAGLWSDKGIIVGRYKKRYLVFGGSQHVNMTAPTRSGKGVGIVIPNLLSWPDSVVILDVKQENHSITSAYRQKHGQSCFLFNAAAADYRTHRHNPLFYISDDPNFRIDDIQKIGNMFFPDTKGVAPIWTATPRMLFLGIVLYLLETPGKPVTMGQVLREVSEGDGSVHFTTIIEARQKGSNPLSGACIQALNSYISIPAPDTRGGIIGGFRSRLDLWLNPLVDAATSANDFDLRELRTKRMSIYVGITPDNLDRMAPLLNLFFQQLIDLNTRQLPEHNPALKYQCLLLKDEFTAMGKIPILAKGIGYMAGYGLRMLPVTQSPSQIVEVYGKDAARTFAANHALQIVFPPKSSETQTARDISEWLGYQTVRGVSKSKKTQLFGERAPSETQSDQKRALLLPQEITGLGRNKELIIVEDCPPIIAEKIRYYTDPVFVDRLKSVSRSLKRLGRRMPTHKQIKAAINAGELRSDVPKVNVVLHDAIANVAAPTKGQRQITVDDMPGLDKMSAEEFAINFSNVDRPDSADAGDLDDYADELCRAAGVNV